MGTRQRITEVRVRYMTLMEKVKIRRFSPQERPEIHAMGKSYWPSGKSRHGRLFSLF